MRVHRRARLVELATYEIVDADSAVMPEGTDYVDILMVYNEIERFWLSVSAMDMPLKLGYDSWKKFISGYDSHMADVVIRFGNTIASLIYRFDLTFGELTAIFSSLRANAAKHIIHSERYPDDVDKFGGVK